MDKEIKKEDGQPDRRKFLKLGLFAGGAAVAGAVLSNNMLSGATEETGKKVKVLTVDGKLVEVDSSHFANHHAEKELANKLAMREGIEGKKFVMVIDLARCANARKCIAG